MKKMLGVELYSEILFLSGCIPQETVHPCNGGDLSPPQGPGGSGPPAGVWGTTPPKLKTYVKFPCKSIVISIRFGSLIRQMI
jgi:hypothetical protein